MNRINLVVVHMHQPQYRDRKRGRYVLPWTRLHALKDYWGMVKILEEFQSFTPRSRRAFVGLQLEEYASGKFNEPWFDLALKNAEQLTREDKTEIPLTRVSSESRTIAFRAGRDSWSCTNGRGQPRGAGACNFHPARLARSTVAFAVGMDGRGMDLHATWR